MSANLGTSPTGIHGNRTSEWSMAPRRGGRVAWRLVTCGTISPSARRKLYTSQSRFFSLFRTYSKCTYALSCTLIPFGKVQNPTSILYLRLEFAGVWHSKKKMYPLHSLGPFELLASRIQSLLQLGWLLGSLRSSLLAVSLSYHTPRRSLT